MPVGGPKEVLEASSTMAWLGPVGNTLAEKERTSQAATTAVQQWVGIIFHVCVEPLLPDPRRQPSVPRRKG